MTTSSRIRRAAAVGSCAAAAVAAAAGTAQAQTAHVGVVPQAGTSASRQGAPGSGPMKVRSVEGSAAGTVRPDVYEGCSPGYFCLSPYAFPEHWIYTLGDARLHGGTGYSFPWGDCGNSVIAPEPGCDRGIHAFANNTGDRVWLKADPTGGKELCISNHTWSSNYEGIADNDYWVQITTNPNPCS